VRLSDIRQASGERVRIHWRAFPLIPDQQPGRRSTQKTRDGRQRAGGEEPRAVFIPPPLDTELPASSLPALTAAKCAELQGEALFERFHQQLFVAHFQQNLDIGRADVLAAVARQCRLDVPRFHRDFTSGAAYEAVLHDYAEGAAWFGVSALPTVIFNEKVSLVGAVPVERYQMLLDWIWAGEPGGLIPIEAATSSGGPGQTVVAPES
jgi:predicted DsbA family dithiol-disulfide isomerase